MKPLSLFPACAVLAFAGVVASPQALADDYKAFNTFACQPHGTTVASDLAFGTGGVRNISNLNQQVRCPLVRDQEATVSGYDYTYVTVFFSPGAIAGRATCTAYYGSKFGGTVTASNAPAYKNPGEYGSASLYLHTSPVTYPSYYGQLSVICTITPQTTLDFIQLDENGITGG